MPEFWPETVKQARKIQEDFIQKRNFKNLINNPGFICGCDVNYSPGGKEVKAACAVFSYPDLEEIEIETFKTNPRYLFPYIPGLLGFRELPFLLQAIKKIKSAVDIFIVDGQGRLHPRGIGMAVQLGIIINNPTIGCAKNLLYGDDKEVVNIKGAYSLITSRDGKVLGAKVRTRKNTRPVYVSQGWGISLTKAIEIIINSCPKYRLPKMLSIAHREAKL